jgi:hypothetical protein
MIAQRFEFTRHFPKAWNNRAYFQLRKMSCEFKDQVRFCPSGEICGLNQSCSDHTVTGNNLGKLLGIHVFCIVRAPG